MEQHHAGLAGLEPALIPAYPFNTPGESIPLYDGPIGGVVRDAPPGTIEFCCLPDHGLNWKIEHEDFAALNVHYGQALLEITRRGATQRVTGVHRSYSITDGGPVRSSGWINEATLGSTDASLTRVLVHWMNLPHIVGPIGFIDPGDETQHLRGRWRTEIDGWRLTLDIRPDYSTAMESCETNHLSAVTHVMEIRRTDGNHFAPTAVEELLECLRVSFSFAFGRRVAPILPVGYDAVGDIVWEVWSSPICDPFKSIGMAWLHRTRTDDLTKLLQHTIPTFRSQGVGSSTRFQMILAVQAVGSGFVEQRLTAAAPALENLSWQNLVVAKGKSKSWYKDVKAEDKLRFLLKEASISTDIDPDRLTALAEWASAQHIDGPTAVTRIRNRLIHPEDPQADIYSHEGLAQDAWLLGLNYVTLLILYSIGYDGSYSNLTHLTGWAGEASMVPWAASGESPRPAPSLPLTNAERRQSNRQN